MFRELRRKDKKMEPELIEKLLEEVEYGVMSCVEDGGYGYGVPVNHIYMDGAIYFHCAYAGHKMDAIERNSKVSYLVVDKSQVLPEDLDTRFSSVIVFGNAYIVEGDEKNKALHEIGNKFSKGFEDKVEKEIEKVGNNTCVVKIEIEHKEGKIAK
ncbi:hypothetical protein SAMN02745751_02261 [Dethiosulfatibacter aminovorans DSM 17477]|uniref:Nitroimidazol reductase NimA, pyridoxamine 5'-phosphate oxidase superfamily n=1 Tax=Dethiosulfatibacter aminovorans DSM 17477 TaxID=1121476 RepID=A0A1M6IAV5_9FIRM|nr:pyridoxamine 5'-phosphate oxidase family protein [Dethiosulfatibacter aminovorans]SHJ31518.1 hypothetical protein SAMN02745751_02261 [Dethiosulfatibacter aminovorans DSM 17477]